MKVVGISLGGSILSTEDGFNTDFAAKFADLLRKREESFIVCVGGGRLARREIEGIGFHQEKNPNGIKNKFTLHEIGTECTRVNALQLKSLLQERLSGGELHEICPVVPRTLDEFKQVAGRYRITICGGFFEYVTTDSDVALACAVVNGKLVINISNESWVHDKDPKKGGKKLPSPMSHSTLKDVMVQSDSRDPGANVLFDSFACSVVKGQQMKVAFVSKVLAKPDGRKYLLIDETLEQLERVIDGKEHDGTLVVPDEELLSLSRSEEGIGLISK